MNTTNNQAADTALFNRLVDALEPVTPAYTAEARRILVGEFLGAMGKILETVHVGPLGAEAARFAALCVAAETADVDRLDNDGIAICTRLIEATRAFRAEVAAQLMADTAAAPEEA